MCLSPSPPRSGQRGLVVAVGALANVAYEADPPLIGIGVDQDLAGLVHEPPGAVDPPDGGPELGQLAADTAVDDPAVVELVVQIIGVIPGQLAQLPALAEAPAPRAWTGAADSACCCRFLKPRSWCNCCFF